MKWKTLFAFAALAALAAVIWRYRGDSERSDLNFFAMDTPVTLTAYGRGAPEALREAERCVRALERELSVTDSRSAVSRLNSGEPVAADGTAGKAVGLSLELCAETDGAFDPTLYPALRAWGFTTGEHRVPPPSQLTELLARTGPARVKLENGTFRLDEGAMIDLGGIGKGLASDAAAELLRKSGVKSAVLNLGGNVRTLGKRPGGGSWRIGVRDPDGGLLGVIETGEGAVITSGSYERFFEKDGVRYWHILDPKTGAPARSGVVSVTVVGSSGARCDALSTAYFVMGPERAARLFMSEHPDAQRFEVTLYGSLAKTGRGHGTDRVSTETLAPWPVTVLWNNDETLR
ncbi:MAG: FAD:protein FMN transferase, partial [Pyramidobacter sp.]|nr:FAD:protein FMN transferase [Pyramidobacter sp.]